MRFTQCHAVSFPPPGSCEVMILRLSCTTLSENNGGARHFQIIVSQQSSNMKGNQTAKAADKLTTHLTLWYVSADTKSN